MNCVLVAVMRVLELPFWEGSGACCAIGGVLSFIFYLCHGTWLRCARVLFCGQSEASLSLFAFRRYGSVNRGDSGNRRSNQTLSSWFPTRVSGHWVDLSLGFAAE